jgi:mortality factor 4-like protein 1
MARIKHTPRAPDPLPTPLNPTPSEIILRWIHDCDSQSSDPPREQEEAFHIRPSIRIVMPDNLKALIVDDWERVTKNNSVVKLPAEKTIRQIFKDWRDEEEPKRKGNRIDMDVLDEVVAGIMEYFEKMLDKILLYRYERPQYRMLRKKTQHESGPGNGPIDVYGAEHLIRLFSMFPFFLPTPFPLFC